MHIKEEEAEKMHSTSSIKESGSQSGRFLKAVQEVGRVAHQAPKSQRKKKVMSCKGLDQFLKYILSCIYSYWIVRESTTECSGLIREVCVTPIPVKAVMTFCEECRYR